MSSSFSTRSARESNRPRAVLAVIAEGPTPAAITQLAELYDHPVDVHSLADVAAQTDMLSRYGAMIIDARSTDAVLRRTVHDLIVRACTADLVCLILGDNVPSRFELSSGGKQIPKVQACPVSIDGPQLCGRLCALLDYRPSFERIEQYLQQLETWSQALNHRFEEIHNELRLAWRVQQDFLPKHLPNGERARFAALYRPASWVSGDIYDVFRLDETHVGFHVADVVGHGIAAGLMTLFVKRSLITKEITSSSYRLIPPGQALARLNNDLSEMDLPEQQFVTACYGILNTETGVLTVARAGHPFPVVIDPDGSLSRIDVAGSLLGVFDGAEFPEISIKLKPKTKIVFLSDGFEQAFGGPDDIGEQATLDHLKNLASLPADKLIESFHALLDCEESSLHAPDDMTMVVAEYLG